LMRLQNARHFRFAGNAVTTRILRRLQVQTTSSSRPSGVSPNSVCRISPPRSPLSSGSEARDSVLPQTRSLTFGALIGAPTVREGLPPAAQHHTVTAALGIHLNCIPVVHTLQEAARRGSRPSYPGSDDGPPFTSRAGTAGSGTRPRCGPVA
jgi:hypothetical protein